MTGKSHAEIAREALAVLEKDGWNKGSTTKLSDEIMDYTFILDGRMITCISNSSYAQGSHCIGGAVNIAMSGRCDWLRDGEDDGFYAHLASKIAELYPDAEVAPSPGSLVSNEWMIALWNNSLSVTEADVRTVLEKIAAG